METPQPRILVSHQLSVYAESLVAVLAEIRPCFQITQSVPTELDDALTRAPGAVVISDRLTPTVAAQTSGWLLYYPDQANVAVVGGGSGEERIDNPDFPDILAAVDRLVAWCFPTFANPGARCASTPA